MSTNPTAPQRAPDHPRPPRIDGRLIGIMAAILLAVALYATQKMWIPHFNSVVAYLKNESPETDSHGSASHSMSHDETAPDHVALSLIHISEPTRPY